MNVFVVIRDIVYCDCCENETSVEAVTATAEVASVIIANLEKSIVGVVGAEGFYFYRMQSFAVQGS